MTFPLKKVSRDVALEMIDLQDSSFGIQLESIVDKIRIGVIQEEYPSYDHLIRSGHIKALEQTIFNRTGLQMEIVVSQDAAAILSFFINKQSIFLKPYWRGQEFSIKEQQEIIDSAHNKKGFIDLKKAKVGGIFSEYKNKLFLNFHILAGEYQLTTTEIVAIMLHEVGHAFYMCEFSDRLESTNQILANVAKELLHKKEKNLNYVYRELKSIDDTITEQAVEEIVNGHKVIAGYKLFKMVLNSTFSQMSNAKYDETAFEQLADHFPTRFGYGRALITGLDKLQTYFDNKEKFSSSNFFNILMITIDKIKHLLLLISLPFPLMIVYATIFMLFLTVMVRISGDDIRDYTYDTTKQRYKRIRAVYIDNIKSSNLTKEEMKAALDTIYFIDNIITSASPYNTLYSKVANVLFSNARNTSNDIREQQLLEDLAFNDLFLRSAEFKTL